MTAYTAPGQEMVAWREGINIARQLARDVGMIPPLHGDDGDDNENEEEEEDDHGYTQHSIHSEMTLPLMMIT